MSELEPTITELEPTATERLRALLDERGVEWEDMSIRPYACTSWRDPDGEPCTALEGADDIPDGKLSAQALLTPEQAIAATLGSCNCSNSERTGTCQIHDCEGSFSAVNRPVWRCDCGAFMTQYTDATTYHKPRFCPNCGRRFEVDDG